MKSITVRGVPEEIHRQLRIRAARNGRSLEAELRAVFQALARPKAKPAPQKSKPELTLTENERAVTAHDAMRKVRRILTEEEAAAKVA